MLHDSSPLSPIALLLFVFRSNSNDGYSAALRTLTREELAKSFFDYDASRY
jgi:hypothetical protein